MIRILTLRSVQMVLLMALLLFGTWMSGSDHPGLRRLQYLTFDTFNNIKPRDKTNDVVIVDIDESSLATLGQWPWPRDVLGKMVEKLGEMGAASIVFDMVFAEADRTAPSLIAKRLPEGPQTHAAREALLAMPDNDTLFAESIRKTGNVVTGFVWTDDGSMARVPVLRRGMVMAKQAELLLLDYAMQARHLASNLPALEEAAAGNGTFSESVDLDGICRRVPLVLKYTPPGAKRPILYPSLALEALRVALGGKNSVQIVQAPQKSDKLIDYFKPLLIAKVGPIKIPLDADGQVYVYYTPKFKERYIPAWRVLAEQINPESVAGKIVMIGTSAQGLKDLRSSPLDLFVPGVEMHVNVIEQALQGKFLLRPAFSNEVEALFIFLTGLLVIVLAPFINLFVLMGVVMALIVTAFSVSWQAFSETGVLIEPIYPSIAVLVMFVVSAMLSYLKAEYERGEIRDAFGLYISPEFMTELTKNPDKLQLGGEIKPLTVMFTDIRNFTTIAEGMTPQVLINTMNDFLTPMSDEVMKARGTIDKYMGDAMMAFWNAPLDVPDHEKHAVRAALAMSKVLTPVNVALKQKAEAEGRVFHQLNCGIGINTGPVAVGNMGSRQRFAYSALGDAVNLASRLEGQTKAYGLNILIGETTAENVREFAIMEIDLIKVKGKTEPVRIYTVLGDEEFAAAGNFKEWQGLHQAFLEAYRGQKFEQALATINQARAMDSQDMLGDCYMVFEMRIQGFLKEPPPQDWDGVYVATSK